jgi:glutaredoxin-like YruB-family protein
MKPLVSLILATGLLVAGWMNRDKLGGLWAQAGPTLEQATSSLGLRGVPTPHPARTAQAQALAIYPGLARADSELNRKFVAFYKQAQVSDPALLAQSDWPLQLAERAVVSLGAAPLARSTPVERSAAASLPQRAAKQVVVYTTSHCPYCVKAKQYLTQKGVRYREVDIERSITGKDEYRRLGGNGVPLIMVGNKKVDGFDPDQLDRLL